MRRLAAAILLLVSTLVPAGAVRVPGGDAPSTDCYAEFEVLGRPVGRVLECTDCDPACDRDGVAEPNGTCAIEVAVCLNQERPLCLDDPLGRVRAKPRSAGFVLPPLDASACGPFSRLALPARPAPRRGKRLKVRAASATFPRTVDKNLLEVACRPRPAGEACPTDVRDACANRNPDRNLYFGDLHVHTRNSFDASAFDVQTTPEEAYAFALGAPVHLPPLDAGGQGTRTVTIDRPLDFAAVTDHSEYLGEISLCTTPGSSAYGAETCTTLRNDDVTATVLFGFRLANPTPSRMPDVCGPDGTPCVAEAARVWDRVQQAAESAYDRSAACRFSSFVAYEYTAATNVSTLHRNVLFKNARVPVPTTYFDEPTPQGLWAALAATCRDAGTGCDVLAIPHNSNESNGKMFRVEYPGATTVEEEREQAAFRAAMEPSVEVYQHKGDSECMNGLSGVLGAPDELCGFEKEVREPFEDCGDGVGTLGAARLGCFSRRDFLRGALLEGLREEARLGVNPFPLGFIGSTDTHNGTPGMVAEDTFAGHRGMDDDSPDDRLGRGTLTVGGISFSPGGLAAVWAEENSRASLFDAIRRRETYATSGPRMAVRLFGGFGLAPGLCTDPDMVAHAAATGVPMGGDLPAGGGGAPSFLVSALRDPGTVARPGTPLQRLQVVKAWLEGSDGHVQVYDVAGDPLNGATVDTDTCATSGPGFDSLCTVWTDPDFDAGAHAVYYARVVENPTCRWHAYECARLAPEHRPAACDDPSWPKAIQERAWTSAIRYRPGA